jgi:hypothetical protein
MSEEVTSKLNGKNLNEVAGGYQLLVEPDNPNAGLLISTESGEIVKISTKDGSESFTFYADGWENWRAEGSSACPLLLLYPEQWNIETFRAERIGEVRNQEGYAAN